jgi:hypothetical protein
MSDGVTQRVQVTKTTRFEVTFEKKQYDKILRAAAGAPDHAEVNIEDHYGGDIKVIWTIIETEGDD